MWLKILIFIGLPFLCGAQTQVTYSIDTTGGHGIYLVERVERAVQGSERKQVIETPAFFRDTTEVKLYLQELRKAKSDSESKIQEAARQLDFLSAKIKVISSLADSILFRPKLRQP